MRKYIVLPCAALLFGFSYWGQQPSQTQSSPANQAPQPAKSSADSELTNLLDAKIKAEWEAIKTKNAKALGPLLTDDYVAVEADREGERYKWKVLNELQQSLVADYTLSFLKVTKLCQEAAFVRYEVFIKFPPKSLVPFEKLLVAEVWVNRDGQWQSMHYQETKVK